MKCKQNAKHHNSLSIVLLFSTDFDRRCHGSTVLERSLLFKSQLHRRMCFLPFPSPQHVTRRSHLPTICPPTTTTCPLDVDLVLFVLPHHYHLHCRIESHPRRTGPPPPSLAMLPLSIPSSLYESTTTTCAATANLVLVVPHHHHPPRCLFRSRRRFTTTPPRPLLQP